MTIDERIARLPVWAQNTITNLRNDNAYLQGKLTTLLGPETDLWKWPVPPGIYVDAGTGSGTAIRLPDAWVSVVGEDGLVLNVQNANRSQGAGIYLNGRDAFAIHPRVSNAILLRKVDRQ